MNARFGNTAARRYLLGLAGEAERESIEREYFGNEQALESVAWAEDELIEDYLAGRLSPDERVRFDDEYLASPRHRRRVDILQRLMNAPSSHGATSPGAADRRSAAGPRAAWIRRSTLLPLAASLALAAGAALWLQPWRDGPQDTATHRTPDQPAAVGIPDKGESPVPVAPTPEVESPPARSVVALSLSPIAVRGASPDRPLVLPEGRDALVRLDLEGHVALGDAERARVVIRTIPGEDVWEGAAVVPADLPPGVVARVEVPASHLRADDYVVSLLAPDPQGVEQERYRYFLRVRIR